MILAVPKSRCLRQLCMFPPRVLDIHGAALIP